MKNISISWKTTEIVEKHTIKQIKKRDKTKTIPQAKKKKTSKTKSNNKKNVFQ